MVDLADVLGAIAEIEGAEGYEGPHIAEKLQTANHRLASMPIGEELWQDHVVGEIGRACSKNRWRIGTAESYPDDELIVIMDIWRGSPPKCYTGRGESRALAAALAWRKAISED